MFRNYTTIQLTDLLATYPWFTAVRFELVRRGEFQTSAIAPYLLAGATHPKLFAKPQIATPTQFDAPTTELFQTAEPGTIDISVDSVTPDDELISETLAQIYLLQGLSDKAVETYRKLSLKFPEKSAYFALQIQQITN